MTFRNTSETVKLWNVKYALIKSINKFAIDMRWLAVPGRSAKKFNNSHYNVAFEKTDV